MMQFGCHLTIGITPLNVLMISGHMCIFCLFCLICEFCQASKDWKTNEKNVQKLVKQRKKLPELLGSTFLEGEMPISLKRCEH